MHSRWEEIYDWAGVNVRDIVNAHFDTTANVLDVGAGQGKYRILLNRYPNVDACEIHPETVDRENLNVLYRHVYVGDICDVVADIENLESKSPDGYGYYDLFILGDVLEHIDVVSAQGLICRLWDVAADLIVVVPYLYPQEPHDDNEYQRHIQDDLTPEVMAVRYPNLRLVMLESHGGEPFKGIYRGR